jgi:hypothetical protein
MKLLKQEVNLNIILILLVRRAFKYPPSRKSDYEFKYPGVEGLRIQSLAHREFTLVSTKTGRIMIYSKVVALYSEDLMKHTNTRTLHDQIADILNVLIRGTSRYDCPMRG